MKDNNVSSTHPLQRIVALDALRGITVAAMLLVNDPGDWDYVFTPLDHAPWNGFTPTDLVFPVFLFVLGISAALSILPRLEQGMSTDILRNAALWRAVRLVALGLAINVLAAWWMPGRDMRIPGVLQRIGVCFAVVSMFAIYTPRRAWWVALAALLLGYAWLLAKGGMVKWDNIADRVDGAVFGHYVWEYNRATGQSHDPEGLLSTLSAIATSLLGLIAGTWLRRRQFGLLLLTGVVSLALGLFWSHHGLPFNKNLWTPSFMLWTGGLAIMVLLVIHFLVDRCGFPAWGRRFGMNAITAYAGSEFMQVILPSLGWQGPLYRHGFSSWIAPLAGDKAASLGFAVVFVLLWWVIVWRMDRHRIYWKI